ncbi:hypothetical protein [Rhizobium sullae]|uniref:hypothetical protein n=1 Tax=Rhizobium sullae TaxID=50338 RepID=UPI000B3618A9|nr:hypothetical protein [Rhizobium sullae]
MPTIINFETGPKFSPAVPDAYARLLPLCASGLRAAANPETGLFDLQIRDRKSGQPTRGTENITSTLICLIGLDRAGIAPSQIGLPSQKALSAALDRMGRERALGATGLAIWANAVLDGLALGDLLDRIGVSLNDRREWADRLTTMEVAWLASGLLHELGRGRNARMFDLARSAVSVLWSRYDENARLVSHASAAAPLRHRLRRQLANFADQIYAVQALAFAAIVLYDERALRLAERIAGRLTELQGSQGQWWWHYDVSSGRVAEGYPVYSVHQHAMAPMALMILRAAGGGDYSQAIERSQRWVLENELGVSLIDEEATAIWRNIERSEPPIASLGNKLLALAGRHRGSAAPSMALCINHEIRPYEWGWCLYAASLDQAGNRGRHIV